MPLLASPRTDPSAPATIWQNIIVVLAGSVRSRADWRHAENDVDLLVIDFDPLDEETDQGASVRTLMVPCRAAWRLPRRLRSRILARSYSATMPWT